MGSSRTGFMAIKKETTVATAVKPTNFLPYKSGGIEYKGEIILNNPIKGIRWNALQAKKGKVETNGSFEFDLDTYFIGYALYGVFGGYSISDLTNAYKHTFSISNTLPSFSIEEVRGNPLGEDREVVRSFGVMFDNIELGASDGIAFANTNVMAHGIFNKASIVEDITSGAGASIVIKASESEGVLTGDIMEIVDVTNTSSEDIAVTTYTPATNTIVADAAVSYSADDDVKLQLRPQTPSFTNNDTVLTFSNFNFQFGADLTAAASAAEENVENWTLAVNNNLEMRYGSKRKSPSVIAPKGGDGNFKYTKYFENLEDRDRYLNQTRQACIITGDFEQKIGATVYNFKIEFRINDLRFTARTLNVGNDELLVTELESAILYNGTDGKEIECNIWNDLPSYST